RSTSRRSRASSAATPLGFRGLGLQVDDDVRDVHVEALARGADDPALEPVRLPGRMRGDDDLVRMESPDRIFDRDERVEVAHLAFRLDADLGQAAEGRIE